VKASLSDLLYILDTLNFFFFFAIPPTKIVPNKSTPEAIHSSVEFLNESTF